MKNIYLSTILFSTFACSSMLYASTETSCKEIKFATEANTFAQHYYLNDVMEVGSELLLEKDGKFKWYLIVGSLDQYAEGTWWKNGNCIGLKAESKYKKDLQIFPVSLQINDKNLDVI